jgi:hypothetical protein
MASIKTLIQPKVPVIQESNLDQGEIWVYSPGTSGSQFVSGFCWRAPGTGTAVIEAWGAGGPGARMCCCGMGIPGNSGSYTKKTISVISGCYVCGSIGSSPTSATLNFAGCGDPTRLCWFGSGTSGCICSEGGMGGCSICTTGSQPYCCFTADGSNFCRTQYGGAGCGMICNYTVSNWKGCSYGGDINCNSIVGCSSFMNCYAQCACYFYYHVPVPAGYITKDGTIVTYTTDADSTLVSEGPGQPSMGFTTALNAASRSPKLGQHPSFCWSGARNCGCYDIQGCSSTLPIGVGGLPPQPCAGVRDNGTKGGWGAVRIRFI